MKKFKSILMCALVIGAISCNQEQNKLESEVLPILEIPSDPYHITMDDAEKDVENLLKSFSISETKGYTSKLPRRISSKWSTNPTVKSGVDSDKEIYIFNFSDSLGFAIYSSNPKEGLLGFALDGSLHPDSEIDNPGFLLTLGAIESQLDTEHVVPGPGEEWEGDVYGEWVNEFYEPATGYCKVKWGQRAPYNQYCFTLDGDTAAVGCVAVATGQLMSMYKFPSTYSSYTFDWDSMIVDPYSCGPSGMNYTARLMQQLGTPDNLYMDYGVSESGADQKNIPRTLQHFGYTDGGECDDYDSSEVLNELNQGYPIILVGWDHKTTKKKKILGIVVNTTITYSGGHCWLVHGYLRRSRQVYTYSRGEIVRITTETSFYLLCNFGWNGSDDGFYPLNAFDTNSGPAFDEGIITRSTTTTTEGTDGDFQYNFKTICGIRL